MCGFINVSMSFQNGSNDNMENSTRLTAVPIQRNMPTVETTHSPKRKAPEMYDQVRSHISIDPHHHRSPLIDRYLQPVIK